ncbi:hypothetical protein AQ731_17625 [Burkholderia pseudomallei]|nr:hypothetical protein ACT79_08470 [Burkholderia pseudomallei]ARK46063.1 hypothetical protein BOC35_06790 [Burkholderia pseudomallei]ARK56046.1 hypothetical protein BOC36_23335 [Burkholderia pseudomallei]ARK70914.1 hypothetical protein BOC38_30905 [Burkholderia pseudomallei]ARK74144.1 hypothetical protein BOC39_11315 [Burkholderia pseudomallei]
MVHQSCPRPIRYADRCQRGARRRDAPRHFNASVPWGALARLKFRSFFDPADARIAFADCFVRVSAFVPVRADRANARPFPATVRISRRRRAVCRRRIVRSSSGRVI